LAPDKKIPNAFEINCDILTVEKEGTTINYCGISNWWLKCNQNINFAHSINKIKNETSMEA
jgi:hypothetical protein